MEEYYTAFESFLEGSMEESDRLLFLERLENEKKFKKEFDNYRQVRSSLQHSWTNEAANNALRETLDQIETEYSDSEKKTNGKTWFWIIVISVAISILILFYYSSQKSLFEEFYKKPEIALVVKSNDQQLLIQNAEAAYENGAYQTVADILDSLLIDDPNSLQYQFYRAITSFELGESDRARLSLQQLANGNSALSMSAEWYLALTYLEASEYENCRAILKEISSNSPHKNEAERLLRKLNTDR